MRSPILTATLALALASGPALAGGFAPVVVDPEPVVVVEPEAPRSTWGVLLPLLLLGALIVIATQDDDEECDEDYTENPETGECELLSISDSRLKTDILRTGTSPSGLPIYSYRYVGRTQLYQGVMAQDLVALRPEAVVEGPFGVLLVDYSGLDVTFLPLD